MRLYLKLSARFVIDTVDGKASEIVIQVIGQASIVDAVQMETNLLGFGTERATPDFNETVSVTSLSGRWWFFIHQAMGRRLRFLVVVQLS